MRKYLIGISLLIAFGFALTLRAQGPTVTPNIGLQIPAFNQQNWQVPLDYDLNLLDSLFSSLAPRTSIGPTTLVQSDSWVNVITGPVTAPVSLTRSRVVFNGGTSSLPLQPSSGTISGLGLVGVASLSIPPGNGVLVACDGTNCAAIGGILPTPANSANFTLSASSTTPTVLQSSNVTDTITITPTGGFTGSVSLSTSGLPSGVTAAYGTNPATSTSVLTLTASGSATPGTVAIVVTGTSGSISATVTINLTVATTAGTLSLTSATCTPTAGSGSDDTAAIQGCLNTATAAGKIMLIPAGTYKISPSDSTGRAIAFPNGGSISLAASVTINVQNSFSNCGTHVFNFAASNVSFTGASNATDIINMHAVVTGKSPTTCEYSHILDMEGTSTGTFSNIQVQWAWGDGIYINNSSNITTLNLISDHSFRNGESVTGMVNHVHDTGSIFQNTTGPFTHSQGVGGGLDVEPNNPGDFLLDVTYTNTQFVNNFGPGFRVQIFGMDNTSQAVGVSCFSCISSGNGWEDYVIMGTGAASPTGLVEIDNSTSTNSGYSCWTTRGWATNGPSLTVRNGTCTNPHVHGADPSGFLGAIEAFENGLDAFPQGNMHYYNMTISANSSSQKYFWFSQNACSGSLCGFGTNVDFDSAGPMTGASMTPPNGIFRPAGGSDQNCAKVVAGVCM